MHSYSKDSYSCVFRHTYTEDECEELQCKVLHHIKELPMPGLIFSEVAPEVAGEKIRFLSNSVDVILQKGGFVFALSFAFIFL